MLILTRRVSETIIIGGNIKVTVIGVNNSQAQISVKGIPRHLNTTAKSLNIGETLIIADNIKAAVLGIKGHQVRIGIEAPKHISVDREEIHKRKLQGTPPPRGNLKQNPNNAYRY